MGACVYKFIFTAFYHPLYALILIYKVWGPVSISISHHLILYTNLLCDVGCLYFTLSPNTNLPFKLWEPVSISLFSPPNSIYKPALCFNSVCVCVYSSQIFFISKYKFARCLMVVQGPMSKTKLIIFQSVLQVIKCVIQVLKCVPQVPYSHARTVLNLVQ